LLRHQEGAPPMTTNVSPAQVEGYEREGILFPLAALSPGEVAKFRAAFGELEARLGGRPQHRQLIQPHLCYRWAYDLATQPAILDAVEALIGPDILVHSASVFPKYPREPDHILWHQDGYYWGLSAPRLVSAWVALTDSNVENGCMRVVAGTHKLAVLPHAKSRSEMNARLSLEVAVEVDEARATNVVLDAGEMSLHHPYIIHGSNPNQTGEKRIGFAIRFAAAQVKQTLPHHAVILARGRDDYHHFELLPKPPTDDIEEGIAAQVRIAEWIDTVPRRIQ
jgi:non-heme Fe2+,alpha-ketoglutarate-dependent halogenase